MVSELSSEFNQPFGFFFYYSTILIKLDGCYIWIWVSVISQNYMVGVACESYIGHMSWIRLSILKRCRVDHVVKYYSYQISFDRPI